MQGLTAGGKARAEESVGAAQTGTAQGGGDGSTAALRSGDGAPQEAAEAARGQKHGINSRENFHKVTVKYKCIK